MPGLQAAGHLWGYRFDITPHLHFRIIIMAYTTATRLNDAITKHGKAMFDNRYEAAIFWVNDAKAAKMYLNDDVVLSNTRLRKADFGRWYELIDYTGYGRMEGE